MSTAEKQSLENLSALVAQIPLLSPEGREINFLSLTDADKWAVSVSRTVLESLMAVANKQHWWGGFSDNPLATQLSKRGYIYGNSFGGAAIGQEVIHFKDWHHFVLSGVNDMPKPSIQAVKVGRMIDDERVVEILSHRWDLVGLEKNPERDWGKMAMRALAYSLATGKLALEVLPFGLGQVGGSAMIEGGYYGLLQPNI